MNKFGTLLPDSSFVFKKNYFDSIADLSKYDYYFAAKNKESFWDTFINWLASFFPKNISAFDIEKALNWTLSIIFVCIAVYIILKLYNVKLRNVFKTDPKGIERKILEEISNINSIDFKQIISQLRKEKNYLHLIRYLFLSILKDLNGLKWIAWHKEKTNYEFKREMKKRDLSSEFDQIVYYYEYIWYGNHSLQEEEYRKIVRLFDDFGEKIQ